ncbi:Uncharacterised protein [Cedecea lapagei]|uniref:Uncharacterized protein n=1 Tax=Cedecea lapagei TaxID=158823 RepID=A0A3S4JDI3_9ENTR|nr:hypothetical protein [Cedecea lapagei]VEB99970.1 Uncharacterised protein [Cedecea lapagei]
MATLTVKVTTKSKWWVKPALCLEKMGITLRLVRESGVESISKFIAAHGFDIKVEK